MGWKPEFRSKLKIAHDKIMIIGRNTLITGSFNFTKTARGIECRKLVDPEKQQTPMDRIHSER